jgi:hypothetical protein
MDLDDLPVGRVLSRREALAVLGATGALFLLGCSGSEGTASTDPTTSGGCVVRPELNEGPYYVDEELNRSDLRSDPSDGSIRAGALLALTFNVSRASMEGRLSDHPSGRRRTSGGSGTACRARSVSVRTSSDG